MKRIWLVFLTLALILTAFACYSFAADIEADSRIAQVMVYPSQALVTRVINLKLNPGEYKILFSNIIPELDENSLKVSAAGNAEVRLQGAQVKKEFLKQVASEKIKQLQDEILKLEDESKATNNLKAIFAEEKNVLDSLRFFQKDQLPKDLITKSPSVKELDDLLKFLDAKLKENYSQVMDADLKIRDLREKIDVLRRELAQISGNNQKIKRSIEVGVEVVKAGTVDLSVAYLVGGASWQPIYDARANFEKSEVEITSYGIISQRTGEDWKDVEVALSTAKPSVGGTMPYVAPWFIRPYQPPREVYYDKSVRRKVDMQYAALDAGNAGSFAESKEELASAPAYSQVQEKGIAVVYKLAKKVDLKSDGAENKLPISAQILKADFEYSTYPRATLSAYLGSRVTNAKDLQLLAGRVNVFLDGDFVSTSNIDNIGPGEEFDLYLGADENVKVKREQIEKKVDETIIGNIPSPTKKTIVKYKLVVESYKTKKIKLKLFEAMPVSEDDRIKVKTIQTSIEAKVKDWKDRKGVWLWELELAPKAKQEIICNYTIEHPREMQVEGL